MTEIASPTRIQNCTSCGRVTDGGRFCPYCGAEQSGPAAPPPRRRRSRALLFAALGAGGVALAASGAVAGTLLAGDDAPADARAEPPATRAAATFPANGRVSELKAGFGSLWILDGDEKGRVLRLSAQTNERQAEIDAGGYPDDLAVDDTSVWVANTDGLTRIDPSSDTASDGAIGTDVDIPTELLASAGAVWEVDYSDTDTNKGKIVRVDSATREAGDSPIEIPDCPSNGAFGEGALYLTHTSCIDASGISRVGEGSGVSEFSSFDVGGQASVAVGGGVVWVANAEDGVVTPADPRTLKPLSARVPVGHYPTSMVADDTSLWIALSGEDAVARVGLKSRKLEEKFAVGDKPGLITAGEGHVWVYNGGDKTISRIDP